ncbi:MAG: hypothetical protein AAF684_08795 [Pseudomonadota bacterium]
MVYVFGLLLFLTENQYTISKNPIGLHFTDVAECEQYIQKLDTPTPDGKVLAAQYVCIPVENTQGI